MIVDVTQDDIDAGVPNDCHRCAIVRALRRGGLTAPTVTVVNIKFLHPNNPDGAILSVIDTPPAVADWIEYYDDPEYAGYARPFSFHLPVPAPEPLAVEKYLAGIGDL